MNSMLAHTFNWVWVFKQFLNFLTMMIPTIRDHSSTVVLAIAVSFISIHIFVFVHNLLGIPYPLIGSCEH